MSYQSPTFTEDEYREYLPPNSSPEEIERSLILIESIQHAIRERLPIALRYNHVDRLLIPASIYFQSKTEKRIIRIPHPTKGIPYRMNARVQGARKTIGFDALDVMDTTRKRLPWNSYQIDRVDGLRRLMLEEIEQVFPGITAEYMTTPTPPPAGHVHNWNYDFRSYIIERDDSQYDLLPRQKSLQSDEKSI